MVKTLGILIIALAAALGIAAIALFRKAVVRRQPARTPEESARGHARRFGLAEEPLVEGVRWIGAQNWEEVSIESFDGLRLRGRYLPAEGKRRAILFHGYRSSAEQDFCLGAPLFHALGYDILLVDQRCHGGSEGTYIGFGTLERYDCRAWAEEANRRWGEVPTVLAGISMGATTVLMAAGGPLPGNVKAILADCGFTSARDILRHELRTLMHLPAFPFLPLAGGLNRLLAGWGFGDYSTLTAMETNTLPVLFVHGGDDNFVPTEMSRENYAACRAEKELLIIPGADHGMSFAVDGARCRAALEAFLHRWVA